MSQNFIKYETDVDKYWIISITVFLFNIMIHLENLSLLIYSRMFSKIFSKALDFLYFDFFTLHNFQFSKELWWDFFFF